MANIRFIYPTDGDMLTNRAGRLLPDGLIEIEAAVEAEQQPSIWGRKAEKNADGFWTAKIEIPEGGGWPVAWIPGMESESVFVGRLPQAEGKYALSVDDNIWWLAELTQGNYDSLFDHPYLAVYKRAHEKYGAKVRLNLFYQVEGRWIEKYGPFNLSMMTDKYKEEFRQNADWLHLAFHSLQENPANPYLHSSYEEVYRDCEAVHREIVRFAGEQSLEYVTTVHFGACSPDGIRALQDLGIWGLMGYIALDKAGKPSVSYNLSAERVLQTQRYGFWRDPGSGMLYGKINVVMNSHSPERIREILEREQREHPLRGFVEIMIHEQYFHEDYPAYEPDFEERIMAGCGWCFENGYEGAFAEEAMRLPERKAVEENADLQTIYERLGEKYDLKLTNTFALEEGYTMDCPVLCGSCGDMRFRLYNDGEVPVFDILNAEGTAGTHFHPQDTEEAEEDVVCFMEGRMKPEIKPFKE